MPFLEEIQSKMREIVNDSSLTFGAEFSSQIVPSFEVPKGRDSQMNSDLMIIYFSMELES